MCQRCLLLPCLFIANCPCWCGSAALGEWKFLPVWFLNALARTYDRGSVLFFRL